MEDEKLLLAKIQKNQSSRIKHFPGKEKCQQFVENLFSFLFLCNIIEDSNNQKLESAYKELQGELTEILQSTTKGQQEAQQVIEEFFAALPSIYELLLLDAQAILTADPAAHNIEEVIVAYPGFFATYVYRISNQLYKQSLFILARFFSEYAHSKTGIDIHPGATIGHSFVIDHGTGVVIGETSTIGDRVKIYQGVTLGALNVSKDKASTKRHPTIEDGVVIYAGATILGGETVIGNGSIIGGNVWLTYSVPVNSVVYHKSEIHVKDNNPFPEPLNFVI